MKYVSYLNQLLQVFWLRPETALFRCLDCCLSEDWIATAATDHSVDLGCGDGLLGFIMAGGRVSGYDAYMDVKDLDGHREGADIFDSIAAAKPILDGASLRYSFEFGVDHKAGLLSKAANLGGFYRNTVQHDLNTPLPYPNERFSFAFSNVLYWLNDPVAVLTDWRDKLVVSGRMIVFVPTEDFKKKAWLYFNAPHSGVHAYLNYFDRGYASLIRHCYNRSTWERIFLSAGLSVCHHRPYLTDAATEIWNIGTRPVAPLLISMSNRLSHIDREACKSEWIDFFAGLFGPVIEAELGDQPNEDRCLFHMYVLEKR